MTRAFLLSAILLFSLSLSAAPVGHPVELSDFHPGNEEYMQLRLRGSLLLRGDASLAEMSGLGWDEDDKILFAITDRGMLLHLKPAIIDDLLVGMELIASFPLLDRDGKALDGHWRDAEGLVIENGRNGIAGDSHLLISFERNHRIERYSTDGQWLARIPLPAGLQQKAFRPRFNSGLEGLTLHPLHGLITGPEYPRNPGPHYLFSQNGKQWNYRPLEEDGALVALEALPNGDLVLLERAYTSVFSPWVISLTRIRGSQLATEGPLEQELLARFDSSEGWMTQNFEGLTRHNGNRFFMVSDDGNKPWAQTQMIYFELLSD
jgi:hypothetical protein